MVFNNYRFFISFIIPSHLTCMGISLILNVVVDGIIGDLMPAWYTTIMA